MALNLCSAIPVTFKDVLKTVESIGQLIESILNEHSLALVIGNNGEAIFTRNAFTLLSETSFSSPLAKLIINSAKQYTAVCGDDCKYFLLILKEILIALQSKTQGNDEAFMRTKFMHEICSLKHILPCIFQKIRTLPDIYLFDSTLDSFSSDLHKIVNTFMQSKFSLSVSKHLSELVCNFVLGLHYEKCSLETSLEYVVSHFDVMCSKVFSVLSKSCVLKGFVFITKYVSAISNFENGKFIIVKDLSLKAKETDMSWKIDNESFVKLLDTHHINQKILELLKHQNIMLLLSPSVCDNNLKLLCEKNNIAVIDMLDKDEIEHVIFCLGVTSLECLGEHIESKHVQVINLKSFSCNKLYFRHIYSNSPNRINAHHIVLSAPIDSLWKEYYCECLNSIKVIKNWISPNTNHCLFTIQKGNFEIKEFIDKTSEQKSCDNTNKDCSICYQLSDVHNLIKDKTLFLNIQKSNQNYGIALTPVLWEFLFKICLERLSQNLTLPYSNTLHILDFCIIKCISKKIGVSFASIKDIESSCSMVFKKGKIAANCGESLEPVACKEIMMYGILDLVLGLLKIDGIISIK